MGVKYNVRITFSGSKDERISNMSYVHERNAYIYTNEILNTSEVNKIHTYIWWFWLLKYDKVLKDKFMCFVLEIQPAIVNY